MQKDVHQERLEYIIDNGVFVGRLVNYHAIIVQADTLDDLKRKAKALLKVWLEYSQELLQQEECFELKEQTEKEWFGRYNTKP